MDIKNYPCSELKQNEFTYNVGKIIEERKLSFAKLARMSGVGVLTVKKLAKNEEINPRLSTLNMIAKALNVPVKSLFVEE